MQTRILRGARIAKRGKHVVSFNASLGAVLHSSAGLYLVAAALSSVPQVVSACVSGRFDAGGEIVCDVDTYTSTVAGDGVASNPGADKLNFFGDFAADFSVVFDGVFIESDVAGPPLAQMASNNSVEGVSTSLIVNGGSIVGTSATSLRMSNNGLGSNRNNQQSMILNNDAFVSSSFNAVELLNGSSSSVSVNDNARIESQGGRGIFLLDSVIAAPTQGDFLATLSGDSSVDVTSTSNAIFLDKRTSGNSDVVLQDNASVSATPGAGAAAIASYVRNTGLGNSTVTMTGGTVTATGEQSVGIDVRNATSTGNSIIDLSAADVNVVGERAVGLRSYVFQGVEQTGMASATVGTGASVTVNGDGGEGVHVWHDGPGTASLAVSAGGVVEVTGDAIIVDDEEVVATALFVNRTASGDVVIDVAGTVSATGERAVGVSIGSDLATSSNLNVTGSLTATGLGARAIVDGAGATTVTVAGTVIGDVELGAGNDILRVTDTGVIDGIIDAGDGNDTLQLSAILNTNAGNNPDAARYVGFEIFEFLDAEGNLAETSAPTVLSGTPSIATATTYRELTVDQAGTVDVSADITSRTVAQVDGTIRVTTADVTLSAQALEGTGTLEVSTGRSLTVSQDGDSTFDGSLSGDGGFVKTGTGRLELSGVHTITGQVAVADGALSVNGNLVQANLVVEASGRLEGSGAVGSVDVAGVVAPGNSPGTLSVAGDFTLNATSVVEIEVDGLNYSAVGGAGSYDRIVLTDPTGVFTADGTLTPLLRGITGAATNSFTPEYGDAFTIVTTANSTGLVGSFASVSQPASGLPSNARFDVLYSNSAIDLVVTPDSYASFAQTTVNTENARNFGVALDAVRPDAGLNPNTAAQSLFTDLYPLNGAEIAAALVPLAGEVHVFAVDDLRNNVERLASQSYVGGLDAQDQGRAIWFDVSAERLRFSHDEVASSYDSSALSMWLGFDIEQRSDLRYGVAVARSWSDVDANQAGRVSGDATMLMGYYATQFNNLAFGATLGIGQGSFDTERTAVLASGVQTETGSGDARFASLNFNLAYEHDLSPAVQGTFRADVSTMLVEAGGYNEAGATDFASSLTEEFYRSGAIEVGYELAKSFVPQMDQLSGSASVGVGLRHEFGRDRQYTRELEMHGASWTASGQDLSPTSAYVSFGADFDLGNGGSLSANMFGEGNHDYSSYGAALNFVRRF